MPFELQEGEELKTEVVSEPDAEITVRKILIPQRLQQAVAEGLLFGKAAAGDTKDSKPLR